jgi:hypothetical protein
MPKIEAAGSFEMILTICQKRSVISLQFYLLDVTPLLGEVKLTDVNLRIFGSCTTTP